MIVANLVLSFILLYRCKKVPHDIIDRLASAIKHQRSPLIGWFTDHAEMVEPD